MSADLRRAIRGSLVAFFRRASLRIAAPKNRSAEVVPSGLVARNLAGEEQNNAAAWTCSPSHYSPGSSCLGKRVALPLAVRPRSEEVLW